MKYRLRKYLNPFELNLKFKSISDFFLKISVVLFVVVAATFSTSGYMRPTALILISATLFQGVPKIINALKSYPPELKCLNIWLVWSFLTGVLVAENMQFFMSSLESVTLVVVIVNVIFVIVKINPQTINFILIAVLSSAIIHYVAMNYGFVSEDDAYLRDRAQGLANNPNTLGVRSVYSAYALLLTIPTLLLWKSKKSLLSFVLLSIVFSLILATGSKKSAVAFFVLLFGFMGLHLSNTQQRISLIRIIVISFISIFSIQYIFPILIEGTVLEQRFIYLEEKGGLTGDVRFLMVTFGWDLFSDNPFFGVGFDNYRHHAPFKMYSHNDFIESLTSTGLIGFVLYQIFWVIILIRTYKLIKIAKNNENRFYLGMIIIGTITLKVIGLGQILYLQPVAMIILATLSAYTWHLYKNNDILKNI